MIDHQAPSDVLKTFTRRYAYDGEDIVLEFDHENQILVHYTHSGLGDDDVLTAAERACHYFGVG